jgi:hypothetical protein
MTLSDIIEEIQECIDAEERNESITWSSRAKEWRDALIEHEKTSALEEFEPLGARMFSKSCG